MAAFVPSSTEILSTGIQTTKIILYGILDNMQIRKSTFTGISIQVCMPDIVRRRLTKTITLVQEQAPQDMQYQLQSTLESFYREFIPLRDIISTNTEHKVAFICINLIPDVLSLIQTVYHPGDNIVYDICESLDDAVSKYADYLEILSPPTSARSSSASSPFPHQSQPMFDDRISTITFPNASNQIIYLSGDSGANDFAKLSELGITHILNVSDCIPNYYENTTSITYMRVPIADCGYIRLNDYFPAVFKFITSALESGGRILVHCFAGKSRSASFVIAYLMHRHRMNYNEALLHVQSHRAVVELNLGFELQLYAFEKQFI